MCPAPTDWRTFRRSGLKDMATYPEKVQRFLKHRRPFSVRVVPREDGDSQRLEPVKYVWMKAIEELPDDPALHQRLLAYISDYQLLATATLPHGDLSVMRGNLRMASLDHAMWFHRPVPGGSMVAVFSGQSERVGCAGARPRTGIRPAGHADRINRAGRPDPAARLTGGAQFRPISCGPLDIAGA